MLQSRQAASGDAGAGRAESAAQPVLELRDLVTRFPGDDGAFNIVDGVSLTVTASNGFPTDTTEFASMDAVQESADLASVAFPAADSITATLAGRSVSGTLMAQ